MYGKQSEGVAAQLPDKRSKSKLTDVPSVPSIQDGCGGGGHSHSGLKEIGGGRGFPRQFTGQGMGLVGQGRNGFTWPVVDVVGHCESELSDFPIGVSVPGMHTRSGGGSTHCGHGSHG